MSQTALKGNERLRHLLVLLIIMLLSVITFWPTFANGFQMEWDDQWMVVNSQTVRRWNKSLLLSIFIDPSHGQLAPINQMLYTILYKAFGFNPLAFHIASLILHIINACLLYVGLKMVLSDCTKLPEKRALQMAAITTVIFAIHPIQVESVAWISASKIPLFTTFYFSASIILMRYLRKGGRLRYATVLLIQLMAYLSKEQAVVFPLFAALLFVWYGIRPNNKKFWIGVLPFCVMGVACVVHEVFYVANYDQYIQGETYVWWQRMILSIYSLITYFFKWLVPTNLNWMYLFPMEIGEQMPWWLFLYPVLVMVLIVVLWNVMKQPIVLSALSFFIIHLILVIHVTALPRASVVADRYMYIPVISLNFLFAYAITGIKGFVRHPKLLFPFVFAVVLTMMGISFSRTMDWKDSKTLKSRHTEHLDTFDSSNSLSL